MLAAAECYGKCQSATGAVAFLVIFLVVFTIGPGFAIYRMDRDS
jgi:hypothetical protein